MTHETTDSAIKRRRFTIQFKKVMRSEKDWRDSRKILCFLKKLGAPTSIRGIMIGVRGFSGKRTRRLLAFLILHNQVGRFKHGARYRYGTLGCAR